LRFTAGGADKHPLSRSDLAQGLSGAAFVFNVLVRPIGCSRHDDSLFAQCTFASLEIEISLFGFDWQG
jgi:hypothetical protein